MSSTIWKWLVYFSLIKEPPLLGASWTTRPCSPPSRCSTSRCTPASIQREGEILKRSRVRYGIWIFVCTYSTIIVIKQFPFIKKNIKLNKKKILGLLWGLEIFIFLLTMSLKYWRKSAQKLEMDTGWKNKPVSLDVFAYLQKCIIYCHGLPKHAVCSDHFTFSLLFNNWYKALHWLWVLCCKSFKKMIVKLL